jgi:CHASE3 domain sensor protein
LKDQGKQNSQVSNPVEEFKPAKHKEPVPVQVEDDEFEEDIEEDIEEVIEAPVQIQQPRVQVQQPVQPVQREVPQETKGLDDDARQQILMEIEMLQNNGRYRAELLHQLQELNKALIVIAGVLVDLTGDGKQK